MKIEIPLKHAFMFDGAADGRGLDPRIGGLVDGFIDRVWQQIPRDVKVQLDPDEYKGSIATDITIEELFACVKAVTTELDGKTPADWGDMHEEWHDHCYFGGMHLAAALLPAFETVTKAVDRQ